MANRAKAKGDAAERAVTATLNAAGIPSRRMPAGSSADRGDLWVGDSGRYVIDVKDRADWSHLGGWAGRLGEQVEHQAATTGALVLKRRGSTDPLTWWVVRPLALELDVIRAVDLGAVGVGVALHGLDPAGSGVRTIPTAGGGLVIEFGADDGPEAA